MASDLIERLLQMARECAGQRWPRETWVGALTEATGLIRALTRELEATSTALAEQSRLNAEMMAEAYRRGVEDEKDRLLAVCEDRQGDTTDAERWEEAVHSGCFLEDQGAMLPAERAAIRSLPADKEGA